MEQKTQEDRGNLSFTVHKYQEKLLESNKRFLFAVAGIQSGKTWLGCTWLIKEILKGWHENKNYSYLIAAPTYKILSQSTIRKWLELAPAWLGEYKEQKSTFELADGKGIIYIRSTDEPYGLEGMTLKAAWLDEAGQMSDDVWRIVQGRLSILHGRCLVTTTPYTFNWVYEMTVKNKAEDTLCVTWESSDSPWFPKKEYERQKRLAQDDPSLMADFDKRYRGVFRRMSGAVYANWHDKYVIDNVGDQLFKEHIGGIDWGYTQPAAIEIVGFSDTNPACVLVDEYYQSGKTIDEIAAVALALKKQHNVRLFYADPSRPDYIQDLNTRGIPVIPANNDIKMGIAVLQRLIKGGNLHSLHHCVHFLDEISTYHYPEVGEEVTKEIPVATKDHALDAVRYCIATHIPIEVIEEVKVSPQWKEIKESLKTPDEYEESMGIWMEE